MNSEGFWQQFVTGVATTLVTVERVPTVAQKRDKAP